MTADGMLGKGSLSARWSFVETHLVEEEKPAFLRPVLGCNIQLRRGCEIFTLGGNGQE